MFTFEYLYVGVFYLCLCLKMCFVSLAMVIIAPKSDRILFFVLKFITQSDLSIISFLASSFEPNFLIFGIL